MRENMRRRKPAERADAAPPQPFESGMRQQSSQCFEPLLDDDQAAELLGLHPKTLQRLARRGQIPAYRIGRFWRYRVSELDAWLRSGIQSAGQSARVNLTEEI
ncbi:MAG: helix-turn-helix domain-containing protein [Terriglobales bacterium]